MLTRRAKANFYRVAGPLMWFNGRIYRALRAPRNGQVRVHLGPGQKNYLEGWINVDANIFTGRCDLWADLRNPLPFRSDSVSAFYSHHVIEHLPDISFHLREVYRCLKTGGVYRFGGPNGDAAIAAFVRNDHHWFSDFPDRRQSIGGRFENFIFCRQEHLTILTETYMRELLEAAGFDSIRKSLPSRETRYPALFEECLALEHESDFALPHTLIIEARKPE